MGLKQQQDLLARIYTDPGIREQFRAKPDAIAAEFGLSRQEATALASVALDEVDRFADSLYWKRLREVEKLLPTATRMLGDELKPLFREFSKSFNPTSVKKHLEDALTFSRWIVKDNEFRQTVADVVRFDAARLRHFGLGKRLTICVLGHDVRPLFDRGDAHSEEQVAVRRSIAVWLKTRGRTRFIFI